MTLRARLREAITGEYDPRMAAGGDVIAAAASTPLGAWTRPGLAADWGHGDALAPFRVDLPAGGASLPWSRDGAMTLPAVARARDLIVTAAATSPLIAERDSTPTAPVPTWTPVRDAVGWLPQPDPNRTTPWLIGWTVDDLMFQGVAYWLILTRDADGYPLTFARLEAERVSIDADGHARYGSTELPAGDVVQFLSVNDGVLRIGGRAMRIAGELDAAAARFASAEVPAGVLRQSGGEPLSPLELAELAADFSAARRLGVTAALNQFVTYDASTSDPSKLQLVEGRQYQALELARLLDCPPYLVGADAGSSMTYQNAQQARGDLVDFGALPHLTVIGETLSGPALVRPGLRVRLDASRWTATDPAPTPTAPAAPAPSGSGTP